MMKGKCGSGLGRPFPPLLLVLFTTTLTFASCQALRTREDAAEVASPSIQRERRSSSSEPLYVSPDDAKDQCKKPCFRKCCPIGEIFDSVTWECVSSNDPDNGTSPDVVVVPGLPECIFNFDQTSVLSRDGKGRLKIGSYGVSHEAFCIDDIKQIHGTIVRKSLVCEESLGDAQVINAIRKTSIFANVLSVICVAIIFAIHIARPELNKRLGVTFLFFCAAIFFKGIHESFGRLVKFSAYPTYTACVINSVLLMYARASVPVWLSVLCVEIARRARFLDRGASFQHKTRRCLAAYLLYGLGFPFLQCLIAGIVTTLSSNTQRQSSVYDRTCIFTDRDVRNSVFLYPSIAINLLSSVIILYTYRYKASISSIVSRKAANRGVEKNASGTLEALECAEERGEDRPLLAGFTSEQFVSEFWQQVGLVCFWVLLTTFMVLIQFVTGRGILSHITYLMDSFQGVYVFLIFLCNGSKRQIMKYNMKYLLGGLFWKKLWSPATSEKPRGSEVSGKGEPSRE
ncbi:uncharacterized protein LOC143028214 [Oratosquilla oratoria]|uniref:uncharacterized protein LOC143028214 n=1 Tax=Oratosquilla oratoria TaxID=337810 RepID=UPI003F767D88